MELDIEIPNGQVAVWFPFAADKETPSPMVNFIVSRSDPLTLEGDYFDVVQRRWYRGSIRAISAHTDPTLEHRCDPEVLLLLAMVNKS